MPVFLSQIQSLDEQPEREGECDHPFRVSGDMCLNCGEWDTDLVAIRARLRELDERLTETQEDFRVKYGQLQREKREAEAELDGKVKSLDAQLASAQGDIEELTFCEECGEDDAKLESNGCYPPRYCHGCQQKLVKRIIAAEAQLAEANARREAANAALRRAESDHLKACAELDEANEKAHRYERERNGLIKQEARLCGQIDDAAARLVTAEARAADLRGVLTKVEAYMSSEEGPLYRLWENCDIGDYDDYQADWEQTLFDIRDSKSVPAASVGGGTEWPEVLLYREVLKALTPDERQKGESVYDLIAHLHKQRAFSLKTFGPGTRTAGVVAHIRKELAEIEAKPDDLEEWIDVIMLGGDGAWRTGATPEEIAAAYEAKLAKNEKREWPDWRTADPDGPIEHVRPDARQEGGKRSEKD
jgi:predicted  nucleic acid-binding Zn-ribbon protein